MHHCYSAEGFFGFEPDEVLSIELLVPSDGLFAFWVSLDWVEEVSLASDVEAFDARALVSAALSGFL